MKKLAVGLVLVTFIFISCAEDHYIKLEDGVKVSTENDKGKHEVYLQVISEKIVHVMASPGQAIPDSKSLMIDGNPVQKVDWKVREEKDKVIVSTSKLTAEISTKTGEVVFKDPQGKVLLAEEKGGGKNFSEISLEGRKYYSVQQVFESPDDEAFYGLGQHQHNEMNYKGKDVDIYQHNIVSVVPFLVSNKKYGILWENYSHSKFGDPRDYEDITSLKLYGKDQVPGGLTANYVSKTNPAKIYLSRQEDSIHYEYLPDLKKIPAEFSMENGKVVWEGYMEPNESGVHKFFIYSAGYMKFWFNGELQLDVWRQGWNPWSHLVEFDMEAGKKYPVKLEWIPDAGESFVAFKYKTPYDPVAQQKLSLWSEVADQIDYYFVTGDDLDEVISGYRQLTGKSPIMPKWAMGKWQCRERYKTQEELLGVVKEFRKRHIPLDNIVLDWMYWPENRWGDHNFDLTRFPDAKGMIDELHAMNARLMISVWPKVYEETENYKYMNERGWVYPENIKNRQKDWVGPGYISTFYDAFNAEARDYFWGTMNNALFSKGIDAWWMDATEPDILSNTSIEERKKLMSPLAVGPSAKYYNAFSLVNSQAVYEGQRKEAPDQRVFILTRSAFAGQQRYSSATWSGDIVSRWYDLKAQISAGINFAISGIPYWTTDIGGFAVEKRYEKASGEDLNEWRELNTRWYQFGAFCPLFRVHGQYPYREIYNIAPVSHPAYQSMLFYDQLRYRLIPYIYTLAGDTWHKDYTLMRALVMDFPDDKKVLNIGDQFMFGPALMVCPVYEYKERERKVYLPEGAGWYDLYSGKFYSGGQTITAAAPYERIPVFVKAGSILPIGPEIEYTAQREADELTLWVYAGADANLELYEDENLNYDYEKGEFSRLPISYSEADKVINLGAKKGDFDGALDSRKVRVVSVSQDHPVGFVMEINAPFTEEYTGEEVKIKL
ncbi:MAG: DUF4968 domain-containing protein [Bacteroidales bacterium]|nr:DUF4968 domain-containing protein [Bacteroidales bacterium]